MLSTVAVNGELRRWEDLRLQDFSQGYFFGAGFFTTLRIEAGAPLFLTRHLDRLKASLAAHPRAVRAPPSEQLDPSTVRDVLRRCLATDAALGTGFDGVAKLAVSDGHALLTFRPHAADFATLQREGRAVDAVEPGAYRHGEVSVNHKGLSYFRQYAHLPRQPLLCNEAAQVCELPTANLFFHLDGALVTPPVDAPCLPGIARAVLLDAGHVAGLPVREEEVPLARLARARAAFSTNAVALAVGISHLLDRALPESASLAAHARALLSAQASREP
ncbi:aminotransferase class IV [Corallococcus sp. M34]|uniref:aminotransferase class IV n=1 Tax=Citreicoccus inhibens TaxID=2849499 RepID=UPI001C21182B|nr:aminotransferase class IV [Citreicoccus inhibens]MBU8894144.1 aminotransferase class IV [Citreicoccus inhibens]